jgi:hypothetical protein
MGLSCRMQEIGENRNPAKMFVSRDYAAEDRTKLRNGKFQYCMLRITVIKYNSITLAKNAACAKTKLLSETTRREVMFY